MTDTLIRYNAAKQAVAACVNIDECKDWKDKAAAMAAYAKMRDDDELEMSARRIRARATRRIGELQLEIDVSKKGGRPKNYLGGQVVSNRSQTAAKAGLSAYAKETAIQIASIPQDEFEEMVETKHPATLDDLAERGRKHKELTEEERTRKYRREALNSFRKWVGSWKGINRSDRDEAVGLTIERIKSNDIVVCPIGHATTPSVYSWLRQSTEMLTLIGAKTPVESMMSTLSTEESRKSH